MAIEGSTAVTKYGVILSWASNYTDNYGNPINPRAQIQRTTGTTAPSTANWTTVYLSRFASTEYTDILWAGAPRRWYRVRHYLPGYDPSTWLGVIDARAAQLTGGGV